MAAVRVVVNFRVKPGKYAELFEGLKAVKKTVEGLGATVLVNRQAFGPEAGNIVVVAQYASWDAFAKVSADPGFARLLETMRNNPNPPWESVTPVLYEDVAV